MKPSKLLPMLSVATILLGSGFQAVAELTRSEVRKKGEWTLSVVKNETGKFMQSEMARTYNGEQEIDLQIGFAGTNFNIDSSGDWSGIPDAKSHEAKYCVNDASGAPAWKGNAARQKVDECFDKFKK